jgi:DnaJ family protein A protein 5
MKECYYSILGVDKKADDDVIKRTYRQLALRNHPDKQPEDQREAATARFQLIVEAYECLSDRQERAWYDDHRDQILGGGDVGSGSGSFSTKNDIWKYYSTSCFNGRYDDSDGGFYRTYGDLFEELASLEGNDFDSDSESDHFSNLPSFGDSKTEWEDVQSFYVRWGNFQSSRHFRGFDKWDLRDGENRQVRRAMEVENKKARNIARKEYSTAVRNLVSFVRRRDNRVVEFQVKQAEKERFQKEEKEKQLREREAQKKLSRQQAREEEEKRWAEIERLKQESGVVSSESLGSDSEQSSEEFVCVACRKTFRSEKAFANHENSKKHKQEVEKLRRELLMDDELLEIESKSLEEQPEEPVPAAKEKKKKQKKKKVMQISEDEQEEEQVPIRAPEIVTEQQDTENRKSRRRRANKDATEAARNANECKRCSESFTSKSALFRHLDAAGHHALVDVSKHRR